jgi:NADH-quinone oxidoreductase subunit C
MTRLEQLVAALETHCAGRLTDVRTARGEVSAVVAPDQLRETALLLRDTPELRFRQLIDLCGIDYSAYGEGANGLSETATSPAPPGMRYGVVYHLLSVDLNWRLRLRLFAPDNEMPVVESVIDIWPCANWLEREAFDLFGVIFSGHPDLRRLLTDYGFIGHPFRKDFPLSETSRCATTRIRNASYTSRHDRAARDHAAHRARRELCGKRRIQEGMMAEIRNVTNFGFGRYRLTFCTPQKVSLRRNSWANFHG